MTHTEFILPLNRYFETTKSYILGHFTILDIVFYEGCFYAINMFGDMKEVYPEFVKLECFKIRFEKEDFFVNNKEKLESYPILCKEFPKEEVEFFRKIWRGEQNFIQ